MALASGTRLGPYQILEPLGAGGMGEVYKARDTRLERTVAVKVLPDRLSSPEIRQRFEREAKTISTLSHPNICALYDVGNQDGVEYLVMEFLEGETLADRLARGPLPLEQTLRYGIAVAGALDHAHRNGVVHRDLKPGNVMLTKSGVKLLDFGLAKALGPPSSASILTALPTETPLTEKGALLGTVQYMAPEQLEGLEADSRTDIFALGAVIYEMATGKKAFTGRSQASLMSAILKEEPPSISAVEPMTPAVLDRVVKTCLAKDPEQRWQSARDVARELEWIAEGAPAPARAAERRAAPSNLAWAVAGVSLAAALALALFHFRERASEPRSIRFFVYPPERTAIAIGPSAPQAAISPDGRYLAFAATGPDKKTELWVRPLDSLLARKLTGTEDASYPFWSPDSRSIGFFAQGKLKTIGVHNDHPQTLCVATFGNGGTWSREDIIVFAPVRAGSLFRVSALGGTASVATELDRGRQETAHLWPQFLPDGRHFLYLVQSARRENRGIVVGTLDSKETKPLLKTDLRAAYSPPGYLLFLRQGTLMAQRFDPKSLRLSGEPAPIADEVAYNPTNGRNTFSVSDNGVLGYRSGSAGGLPVTELVWFDRKGNRIGSADGTGHYHRPALSPDGSRIAALRRDTETGSDDVWLIDTAHSTLSRLTFGSANQADSVWSPDGSRIVFGSDRDGASNLYQKASSGAGQETLLLSSETSKFPTDWSRDGRFILYETQDPKTGVDIWVLPLFGDRKPIPFLTTEFNESQAQFSPDGRWIAYVSNESGRPEIYVQAFPGPGGKWQISTAGGRFPRWRRDGRELFYISADYKLTAVPIQGDSVIQTGPSTELFEPRFFHIPAIPYAVSADGQRFLVNTPLEESNETSPITIVVNWAADLKKR